MARAANPTHDQRLCVIIVVLFYPLRCPTPLAGLRGKLAPLLIYVRDTPAAILAPLFYRKRMGLAPSPHVLCVMRETISTVLGRRIRALSPTANHQSAYPHGVGSVPRKRLP